MIIPIFPIPLAHDYLNPSVAYIVLEYDHERHIIFLTNTQKALEMTVEFRHVSTSMFLKQIQGYINTRNSPNLPRTC